MITDGIRQLTERKNLSQEMMSSIMEEITEGKATEAQIASFLTALKMKGETIEEITAAALVMKSKCIKTELNTKDTLDIVGTGGDLSATFNISTASAFVAAAGDIPMAKHGNRAQTSKSGAIDVLEALGVDVNKTPEEEKNIFNKLNLCFMFAPNHHPCTKYAAKVRRELKIRTLFNILGPLTNPADANTQLFGIYDKTLVEPIAKVISNLGVKNAIVVHGKDGTDEATLSDETYISETRNGVITNYTIKPEDFGLKRCNPQELIGGNAYENAQILKDIFTGKEKGAKRDIVILNSALAFYIYGKTKSIYDGIKLARELILSGCVFDTLNNYIALSNRR